MPDSPDTPVPAISPAPAIDWSRARARLDAITDALADDTRPERIQARMARRAADLAAPAPETDSRPTRDLVAFGRGGVRYALPLADTLAVARLDQLVRLPGTDAPHLGILVHRGELFALVDPNDVLDQPGPQGDRPALAIVLAHPDCALALAADTLIGTVRQVLSPAPDGPVRGGLVSARLADGTRVLSGEAFARNAHLIVDHRPRPAASV